MKYYLKNKTGEVINITKQKNFDEAVFYFAKIKNISTTNLLKIYKVVEE